MRSTAAFIILLLFNSYLYAQDLRNDLYQEKYQLPAGKASGPIKIDGILDEAAWKNAVPVSGFWQKSPVDTALAQRQTEARVTYDDNYIYFGFVNYDTNYYVIQTLKRDVDPGASDAIGIVLDPNNGRTNGFLFTVSAFNVQAEDLLTANTDNEISFSWDNKWFSQTTRQSDHWIAEIAIPFKTLRYDASKKIWGVNFIRTDLKHNEYSTWTRIPVNLQFYDFGYTGALVWEQAPPAAGQNITLVPYLTSGVNSNPEDGVKTHGDFNAGFDAKVALSSNLNLDMTVNPDFSQVDVDQQVTNLTRFDIFFPERRTFFLENADLFSNYGIPPARPFYSRTIGLDKDGNRIPIIAGARITGNLDAKTRIGIMNMQTGKKGDFAAQNYTAFSMTRRVHKRSLIKTYYFDREAFMSAEKKKASPLDRYGRNAGVEGVYSNVKGDWQAWGGWHQSWKYSVHDQSHYLNYGGGYFGRRFYAFINYDGIGTNFYTDMGYVQRIENYDAARDTTIRLGYKSLFASSSYSFFPKKGKISNQRLSTESFIVWNPDGSFNELSLSLHHSIRFQNTSRIDLRLENEDLQLQFPTSFTDYDPLPKGHYKYTQVNAEYRSDSRKPVGFRSSVRVGSFYNGTLKQFQAGLAYRAQPWGNFSVMLETDKLEFPLPYGNATLLLIAPRVEINFSNYFSWTTFMQYNTQENNVNINSRLQWRYKPMSDLFLVYTDNYFDTPFLKNRNRAIVFKMNYWLNL